MNTAQSTFKNALKSQFTAGELDHIWREVLSSKKDINSRLILDDIISRLKENEPYQYVLGRAYFYDFELNVSPAVLIPRPETEELVQLICNDFSGLGPKVIDIGTGSGCIALALAKHIPAASVTALDVSPKAIKIAKINAEELHLDVRFLQQDILSEDLQETYDVIVSNPPYIPHKEKALMKENVLEHEPHLALFVDDSEELIFYERIASIGLKQLTEKGKLYFECNEYNADQVKDLLLKLGYTNLEIHMDMQGKKRMASGIKGIE